MGAYIAVPVFGAHRRLGLDHLGKAFVYFPEMDDGVSKSLSVVHLLSSHNLGCKAALY